MTTVSAAKVLDALSLWVSDQIAMFRIRDNLKDGMFVRAAETSQIQALKTYRRTGAFDASVAAGKVAFKAEVRFRIAPNGPLVSSADDIQELRIEPGPSAAEAVAEA